MKSRKVKSFNKGQAFLAKRKLRGDIPLDVSDSGSDIDSESLFHDEIDDFHKEEEDQLSTDDELIQHKNKSSDEEEVLAITDDEKDDSDEDQIEENESENDADEGLPNPEAWGKRKSSYYNADFVDEDRGRTYREEDAEAAKAEAEEAFAIQKSVYSNITADHLGANLFLEGSESSEDEEKVEEDLASATKQEKIKFLKKTSPEMFDFIYDFKAAMDEIKDKLSPLLGHAKERKLPLEASVEYLRIKYQLLLHYSLNISFYMMLKSSNAKVYHHPVLKRLAAYKKLLNHFQPIDDAVNEDIKVLVDKLKQKEEIMWSSPEKVDLAEIGPISQSVPVSINIIPTEDKAKMKKSKRKNIETEAEKEIISLINDVQSEMKRRKTEKIYNEMQEEGNPSEPMEDQEDNQMAEKRTITYQIAKNRGLAPRRKKEYRNPRVKHRMKFRKAKIRRKGQVREVVKEIRRYEGEPTGISTHVVKSIKLK